MKNLFIIFISMICTLGCYAAQPSEQNRISYPIIDNNYHEMPKKFRTTQDEIKGKELKGLKELSVSASGQFHANGLKHILTNIPSKNIIIVDLRQETHFFINGLPISWSDGLHNMENLTKSAEEIERLESLRVQEIQKKGTLLVRGKDSESKELFIDSIYTERQLVELFGLKYMRMPVTDHCPPTDETIDAFIQFVLQLPKDVWVHFHCKGGSGRTTTFLVLFDMIFNAKNVSYEGIIERHQLLGGKDLSKASTDSSKYDFSIERMELIKKFYNYCHAVPDFSVTWSQWIKAS